MGNRAKKVLVVDDTAAMRDLIAEAVKALGYEVSAVGNGEKALNFLKNNGEVDAVITDYNMPVMNGEELTRWIKRDYPEIVVVFASSDNLENFKGVAEAAGADETLDKSEIVRKLPAILENRIGPADPFEMIARK